VSFRYHFQSAAWFISVPVNGNISVTIKIQFPNQQLNICVCPFVFFPHDILTTTAAKITKLDKEMFHHMRSGKPFISRSKVQRLRLQDTENAGVSYRLFLAMDILLSKK